MQIKNLTFENTITLGMLKQAGQDLSRFKDSVQSKGWREKGLGEGLCKQKSCTGDCCPDMHGNAEKARSGASKKAQPDRVKPALLRLAADLAAGLPSGRRVLTR